MFCPIARPRVFISRKMGHVNTFLQEYSENFLVCIAFLKWTATPMWITSPRKRIFPVATPRAATFGWKFDFWRTTRTQFHVSALACQWFLLIRNALEREILACFDLDEGDTQRRHRQNSEPLRIPLKEFVADAKIASWDGKNMQFWAKIRQESAFFRGNEMYNRRIIRSGENCKALGTLTSVTCELGDPSLSRKRFQD